MPVAVRFALGPPLVPAAVGALFMQVATFAVLCVAALVQSGVTLSGLAPFLLAGAIAPGLSNVFITVGIREAGSSRASVAFGTAPLFAVTIAVLAFDERPGAAVLVGALLIVGGGIALALEQERPRHVRRLGIASALLGAALFALRDNAGAAPLPRHGRPVDDGRRRDARCEPSGDVVARRGAPAARRLAREGRRALAAPGDVRRLLVRRAVRGLLPRHRVAWSRRSSRPSPCSASRSPRGSSASRRG